MGADLGNKVTIDQISKIVKLTGKGNYRRDIAEEVGLSTITVWRYQKKFDLV